MLLPLPLGEVSPQVTERALAVSQPLQALRASSPKGEPLGYAGDFPATAEAVPLGKVA